MTEKKRNPIEDALRGVTGAARAGRLREKRQEAAGDDVPTTSTFMNDALRSGMGTTIKGLRQMNDELRAALGERHVAVQPKKPDQE
ncbi:MAG: hypothetical protein M3394_01460 [Actinomycetota bacterium]|nr:hypothetical protein [Actinomycetota bacterium]